MEIVGPDFYLKFLPDELLIYILDLCVWLIPSYFRSMYCH